MQFQITKQQKLTDEVVIQKKYVEAQLSKIDERLQFLINQFESDQTAADHKIEELRHFKNSMIKVMEQIEDDIDYVTEK